MRPSRHAGRTLFAAVALLFATLLTVESTYAQVVREVPQSATAVAHPSQSVSPHSGTGEDDCRPRHTARHTAHVPAAPVPPGHMCGCDFRTDQAHVPTDSVTMRETTRVARSAALPLLHQTLRC